MIGKKQIYLRRNTRHRQNMGHLRRRERVRVFRNMTWLVFMGWVIS